MRPAEFRRILIVAALVAADAVLLLTISGLGMSDAVRALLTLPLVAAGLGASGYLAAEFVRTVLRR